MPTSYDVLFASSNTHKYEEAEKILAEFDIELGFFQTELVEIQDDSLSKIAKGVNPFGFVGLPS